MLYLEIMAGGTGLLAVLSGGTGLHVALTALMLWLLLALAAVDMACFRLPDALNAMLFGVVLLRAPDLGLALLGAFCGVVAFAALRYAYGKLRGREGLGLGDVKMMAGLGALSGPLLLPHLILLAALGALAAALLQRLSDREALNPTRPLPFGAALALAGMAVWIWLHLPH